ncbi:MAG TPA: hypothetical protein VGY31_00780 [Terriglobia bacterium]|nr:hypothetical protein [Terriglobia bacterium]
MFEVGYLGNLDRDLYGFRNANQPIPYGYIGNGSFTPLSSRLPFPNYGFLQLVDDTGVGNYNALSFKATRRFSRGLSLIGSYTYSKAQDDTSGIRTQQSLLFPQNSLCVPCDYGLSDYDVRNRLTADVVYDLPVGRGRLWAPNNAFVNEVLGGWQVSTITTVQDGAPETISDGFDNSSTATGGYPVNRPNLVPGQSIYASSERVHQWLNPAAFAVATPGTFGDER